MDRANVAKARTALNGEYKAPQSVETKEQIDGFVSEPFQEGISQEEKSQVRKLINEIRDDFKKEYAAAGATTKTAVMGLIMGAESGPS